MALSRRTVSPRRPWSSAGLPAGEGCGQWLSRADLPCQARARGMIPLPPMSAAPAPC